MRRRARADKQPPCKVGVAKLKVVILSAGQGKRLSPLTDDRPKCLVELSGRAVLHWQLAHLSSVGVSEAVVVTGFRADRVDDLPARFSRGLRQKTSLLPSNARLKTARSHCR